MPYFCAYKRTALWNTNRQLLMRRGLSSSEIILSYALNFSSQVPGKSFNYWCNTTQL